MPDRCGTPGPDTDIEKLTRFRASCQSGYTVISPIAIQEDTPSVRLGGKHFDHIDFVFKWIPDISGRLHSLLQLMDEELPSFAIRFVEINKMT